MNLIITDDELRQYRDSKAARLHILSKLIEAGAPIRLLWQNNFISIEFDSIISRKATHDHEIVFSWKD